ncbi:hypothetical protein DFA_09102 [Cavenderia fasciculata]|uniref:Transmembrane protein n=1 Tax=Cavenderia fasciculata TaxID=261658 RepID=F4Q6P5_CACFS|nr:uncharacterized protein DFA_09102 [Cavenderia fasciculata]EGG16555.1 hypothetical protein DFA_09102 [Cavenderia fasciculata]|eukprot:XP_004354955.1 hypothetical protein DFA_09102 [Cavenderia fasciculata]
MSVESSSSNSNSNDTINVPEEESKSNNSGKIAIIVAVCIAIGVLVTAIIVRRAIVHMSKRHLQQQQPAAASQGPTRLSTFQSTQNNNRPSTISPSSPISPSHPDYMLQTRYKYPFATIDVLIDTLHHQTNNNNNKISSSSPMVEAWLIIVIIGGAVAIGLMIFGLVLKACRIERSRTQMTRQFQIQKENRERQARESDVVGLDQNVEMVSFSSPVVVSPYQPTPSYPQPSAPPPQPQPQPYYNDQPVNLNKDYDQNV